MRFQLVSAVFLGFLLLVFCSVFHCSFLVSPIRGGGPLFKTLRMAHDEGTAVVKVHVKRDPLLAFEPYEAKLLELRQRLVLSQAPSVLPYQRVAFSDKAGFLIRQYFASNLYDRFSTHPFLTNIEKKWCAYQVLNALQQIEQASVVHGSITCENILVTTWNWIFLSDFASPFKPPCLPDDNPADFYFYFSSMTPQLTPRHCCYVAPERFYSPKDSNRRDLTSGGAGGGYTHKMDVFSVGCAIAEIFLEGEPLFDLSQLLDYRDGKYSPASVVASKIADADIRQLVLHMIQLDPALRCTATDYLRDWAPRVFLRTSPISTTSLHICLILDIPFLTPRLSSCLPTMTRFFIKCWADLLLLCTCCLDSRPKNNNNNNNNNNSRCRPLLMRPLRSLHLLRLLSHRFRLQPHHPQQQQRPLLLLPVPLLLSPLSFSSRFLLKLRRPSKCFYLDRRSSTSTHTQQQQQ